MKLSTTQIDAIVDSIYQKNEEKQQAELKELRKKATPSAKAEAKRIVSILSKIPEDIRHEIICYGYRDLNPTDIEKGILSRIRPTTKDVCRGELRTKIVLASIDSKDLEELKNKIEL